MLTRDEYYESDKKEIGQKIKAIRKDHGLSQDKLAEQMDVERNQIFRHENGLNDMSVGTFFKYADILGVSPLALCPDRFSPKDQPNELATLIPLLQQLSAEDIKIIELTAEHLQKKGTGMQQI